jgi:hypothetical protein
MNRVLCILLLAAAVTMQTQTLVWPQTGDCRVPDAIADDGLDDYAAIKHALDTQGCADLGPGVYDVFTPNPRNPAQRYDMVSIGTGQSLRGIGAATRIRFSGDAGRSDWHGVGLVGNDALLADLTLDTSALVNTEEQTHAVHVTGPALHVTIRGVWFYHPQRGGTETPLGGGDCLKVVSYETRTSSTLITGNHFVLCDRSGVSSVGGFRGMSIQGNTFYDTGDQDIDIEANNEGNDLLVTNNIFLLGAVTSGTFAISLAAPRLDRFVFSDNILNGRGVLIYSARGGTITGNTILSTRGGDKSLDIIKANDNITISNNVIVRTSTAGPNAVVNISHHNTGTPGTFTFTGNILRNETNHGTVLLSGARNLVVTGGIIERRPPQDATLPQVTTLFATQGIAQKIETLSIHGVHFKGPSTHAVQITSTGKDEGVGAVALTGNTALGPSSGYRCKSHAANPVGPMVVAANNWPASSDNTCTVTSGN